MILSCSKIYVLVNRWGPGNIPLGQRRVRLEMKYSATEDNCVGLSTVSLVLSYIQCRSIAPFLYYLPCAYVPPKACNYGEKYLTAKSCLQFCKRKTMKEM
jgi:hypothetical protein